MTDYSKIDFTELKLEQIADLLFMRVRQVEDKIEITIGGLVVARKMNNEWILTASVNGCNRVKIDELWKRTEQVDEFIRQQSRRRITLIELIQELVNEDRAIKVFSCGQEVSYRFNRSRCSFEYLLDSKKGWETSVSLGRHDEIVTILD